METNLFAYNILGTPGMLNNTMSPSPGPKKKEEKRKKLVTAYILFSMDQRRITMEENPGVRFGEISRTIAEKWKQLNDQEKKVISMFSTIVTINSTA